MTKSSRFKIFAKDIVHKFVEEWRRNNIVFDIVELLCMVMVAIWVWQG